MKKKKLIVTVSSIVLAMFLGCKPSLPEDVFPSPAKDEKNGKWGYVYQDKKIIKNKFDEAEDFSSGLARVKLNGVWGYIEKTGKEIIPLKYQYAYDFNDNIAMVGLDEKFGFIDKIGKEIIPLKYEWIGNYPDDLLKVRLNGKYGVIDKTGNEIISIKYEELGFFHEGFARVTLDGKYGTIDKTGKEKMTDLPVTIQGYGKTCIIREYEIKKNEKGQTVVTITGDGFQTLTFVNGSPAMPVMCDFISKGRKYVAASWSFRTNYVDFIFGSSAIPEKIVFYPMDDSNTSKRVEINCE
jgi:hypothetical protein